MRVSDVIDELRAKNIVVYLENGKVKVSGEQTVLTDELLQQLKSMKQEIADYLKEVEALNQVDTHLVINRLIKKGCYFELSETGAEFNSDVLTEIEKGWLVANYKAVLANLFQYWLVKNVFDQSPVLLDEFKFETIERIGLMEDSDISTAYLDGVLITARIWWKRFQNEERELC